MNDAITNETIYEDDRIRIAATGRPYDFIGFIENKTDEPVFIKDTLGEEIYEIAPNDWTGIMAGIPGRYFMKAIKNGLFMEGGEAEEYKGIFGFETDYETDITAEMQADFYDELSELSDEIENAEYDPMDYAS